MGATWLAFKDAVKNLLTVDKDRLNTEDFTDAKITHTVEEILGLIPSFNAGHETFWDTANLTADGLASKGTMPSGAIITKGELYLKSNTCVRQPLTPYDWDMRLALTCGYECLSECGCGILIAIEPRGGSFYIYPGVDADHGIVLEWQSTEAKFQDSDVVSFGDNNRMIEAVAFRVKSQIILDVDKDLAMANALMTDYRRKRLELWTDARKKAQQAAYA